ncbi:Kinesin-like protein [Vigna angularis]|uniref:Kinesin-like protein n=1 Tax=Phaseolus angularis TaxID=3914 RepID=A0A8T0LD24_PHAAN|nr:Kinesin-like protein [Vigna angularis]
MGSEYNKWIILAFVIAISFSVMIEGALAARQLMQVVLFPDLCVIGIGQCPSAPPPPGRADWVREFEKLQGNVVDLVKKDLEVKKPTNGGGEFENEEERTLVSFHNLAKISRPNKNKKRKEGMEVEDGRPWGITISVVELQRPVEQRRTTNNHDSRCSLLRHDALANELAMLKKVNEFAAKGLSPPRKNGFARCQLWEKDMEIREMKDQIKELVGLLCQSEMKRKEVEKELKVREQANGSTLATPPSVHNWSIHAIGTPPRCLLVVGEDCELSVIDLSRLADKDETVREECKSHIARASQDWGFFQVISRKVTLAQLTESDQKVLRNEFKKELFPELRDELLSEIKSEIASLGLAIQGPPKGAPPVVAITKGICPLPEESGDGVDVPVDCQIHYEMAYETPHSI